ncbi:hypothetical protein POM88_051427 [Heracleum sosnowskyi]|uniref:Uncharacterized protein n=1 Tax=Heracleum sosnowskyi TaxID=360622 RepID=A0AAD8M2E5_9APIA|nr:hypothetical protein POM88_051427 [Heracleum sosnowskyi]
MFWTPAALYISLLSKFIIPSTKFWNSDSLYHRRFSQLMSDKRISGRTPYAWSVVGNVICIAVPKTSSRDLCHPTYLHNARQLRRKRFLIKRVKLPFEGMATTFWQPGFSGVVVISFSEGCVEGC